MTDAVNALIAAVAMGLGFAIFFYAMDRWT